MNAVRIKAVRFSQLKGKSPSDYQLLVIDNIGMLSSLYRYATAAYIGGGLNKGIHNILEAAVYGIPVFFGPVHKKFQEAVDLVAQGGAVTVSNCDEFTSKLDFLLEHPDKLKQMGDIAGSFVASGQGATLKVLQESLQK